MILYGFYMGIWYDLMMWMPYDAMKPEFCHQVFILMPFWVMGMRKKWAVNFERKKVFLVGQNLGDMWKCRKHEHPDIWKAAGLKIDQGLWDLWHLCKNLTWFFWSGREFCTVRYSIFGFLKTRWCPEKAQGRRAFFAHGSFSLARQWSRMQVIWGSRDTKTKILVISRKSRVNSRDFRTEL